MSAARWAMGLFLAIPGSNAAGPEGEETDFRAFFDSVPVGQLLLDQARRIRSSNSAAALLFSPTAAELEGRMLSELVSPPSRAAVDAAFLEVSSGRPASQPATVRVPTADGTEFSAEILIFRISPPSENAYGVVARDLRAASSSPYSPTGQPKYTLGELLMANRLQELV